jgi:uncharacterized protein (UPF0261 family)
MSKTVALLGAFDTKGAEYSYLKERIEDLGVKTFMIDVGIMAEPDFRVDVTAAETSEAGGADLKELRDAKDRGKAVAAVSAGVSRLMPRLYSQGKFDGIIALGGTGGTSVACAAMRELPLGVPKVMVSTVAGGDVSAYVGVKDIVMVPSIVDVAGINKISREVFARAAGIICGMVNAECPKGDDKPLICASMFGNTTPAVGEAKKILEACGYEVLVFHCTGTGGKTMESLIEAGLITGVLDLTTTELADELVGGVFSAGPKRLEAAAEMGVPAIVTPGCLDMVNFGAQDTVPSKFEGRTFYQHNPNVTLMRTNVDECRQLGRIMAGKLNKSKAPVTVLLPLKGWSMIDTEGGDFYLPQADTAFAGELKAELRGDIKIIQMDCNINDAEFAKACVAELLENIRIKQNTKE